MDATPAVTRQDLLLEAITHRFGAAVAVDDVSLRIGAGELVSLLGPSGCGKTTLLRIIAGFIAQSAGRVLIGGAPVDDRPANRRPVGIVFQNYALFPHLSVAENIAYGLAARGMARAPRRAEATRMLDLVRLPGMEDRLPRQLSGGQQQRVALARALAVQPAILLLDEPFAALDKSLRLDMQIEVKRLQRQAGITTIMVTHDQEEALSMSDRVAVLSKGRLEQFAPPTEIYDDPASLFVNTFVGAANVLPGVLLDADATAASVRLDAGGVIQARRPRSPIARGGRVLVCLRPEHLRVSPDAPEQAGLAGVVEMALPLGATTVYEIRCGDASVKLASPREAGGVALAPGQALRLMPAAPGLASLYPHP